MLRTNKIEYITNLYDTAYYCKTSLDKSSSNFNGINKDIASDKYGQFLNEKLKNPTATAIAMHDIAKSHPIENPIDFGKNIVELEKTPKIDILVKKLSEIDKSQKKTSYLRREIIANDRISLNTVLPKLTGLQKLRFRFKLMF